MNTRKLAAKALLLAMAGPVSTLMLASGVQAQAVADRTLDDVEVNSVGSCTTLTVNFNIRVQMLSYFPTEAGRELHIRLRPIDPGVSGLRRESIRTPTSVTALQAIDFEGDNPSGPVLSLLFTKDTRFEVEAGRDPNSLVIRLAEPGSGAMCEGSLSAQVEPSPDVAAIAIPEGLYVVNLLSKPDAIDPLNAQQRQALDGRVLYETLFQRDTEQWHRLRAGFYESRADAERARQDLAAIFPDAFVVKVSAEERADGVRNRLDGSVLPAATVTSGPEATAGQIVETAQLIADAEAAITQEQNERAVQLLTKALALPENENRPRAQELIGLTRERLGQTAHAQAEYEEYLRRYPTGDGASRVRQRLAALTGSAAPSQALREAQSPGGEWKWGLRGSVSQFYYRDQSTTKFVDASRPEIDPEIDNSVNLNQLLTTGDINISGGNDQRQIQLRAAGAYTKNFRTGGKDVKSLTAFYVDYADSTTNLDFRLGRQTRNTSGVLGRFDGALLGFQANPKLKVNLVAGFPVLSSRQTYVLKDRYFYGASVSAGGRRSPFQGTLYWFDQRAKGGFVDRQAVGFEGRMLLPRFNAFTIIDYDVKFSKLDLGLITLNYNFPDNSNLSLTADYRQSPLLTTSNALIGQINSTTLLPISDLRGLRPFFTDAQIYGLADDRTLVTKSATVSYSRPIIEKLQANIDITMTNTGGTPATPASSGTDAIAALAPTGTEFYYGAQLVGTGLLWENDIYIFSGRYSDTQRTNSYTLDFNARVPISKKLRVSPRMRYGYRSSKLVDSTFSQLQPTVRINYYPVRHSEIEVELGGNFSRQRDTNAGGTSRTSESGVLINLGYRIDF